MLQWMGGSRRKVNTSRKSTQKRQKQYFEQRKRKQQHLQTDVESYFDENNKYSQQSKNNKSLDVLSLLNLSAVSREANSCNSEGNIEGITLTSNHQTMQCPRTFQTNEILMSLIKEESSSCALVDTVCPKNSPVSAPESQKQKLKGNWNTLNPLKMPTEHQLSVIDILSDDGPSNNFEESAGHEAHVAFSINGLGKVDAETPVHTPERPGRNFVCEEYMQSKERIKANSSFKHLTSRRDILEHELDSMMKDFGLPLYGSPVEPSFCSKSIEDSFSSPKLNLLANKKFSPVPDYDTMGDMFEDEELFGNERRKNIWNARSSFLPDGNEEYGLPCKNKLYQLDSGSIHDTDRNYEHQDFSFESQQRKKRASMMSPLEINDTDSPELFSKHKMRQYFEAPSVPNIKCNYSMGTREYCFGDRKQQTNHSCSASDYTTESFSLPSEESNFSYAVKGDLTEQPASKLFKNSINHRSNTLETEFSQRNVRRKGKFCCDHNDPHQMTMETEFSQKNIFQNGQFCSDQNGGGLENLPDISTFRPAHHSTTSQQRRFDLKNHGFSLSHDDIYNRREEIMGFNLYTEDSFQFEKCRDYPGEQSQHCCKRRSEQPSIQRQARIPFSNPKFGPKVPNLFQNSKRECSVQSGYFDHLQRDISEASNISSSESKKLVSSSSYLEDQCSDTTKEPRCITPDVTEATTNASKPLELAEEISSYDKVAVAIEEIQGSGDQI